MRMLRGEGSFWNIHLSGVPDGTLYGFRVQGPWVPETGLRYNANKLLLDPYARVVVGDCRGRLDMLTIPDPRRPPGSTDNGPTALKGALVCSDFDWRGDTRPSTPWENTVIYELHVKGFTRLHPTVPERQRGTYAGLAHPEILNYLRHLGVTAVQLLPVHQHLDDGFLVDKGLTNYWGYNTIGFFAPHAEYAAAETPEQILREFKEMVKAFHTAGIEVILDVVYNHTAEGDENGPSIMFRGLDNAGYYRLIEKDETQYYQNMTGCGNAVASHRAVALRLILDSLRYWVEEMHVDGFRFDLGVTVARSKVGYDRESAFLVAVAQDPVLSKVKLIAEPWDVGEMDSYQVGNFPAPWRELNGRFRDTVRRYWRGDDGTMASFGKRISGSQDIFGWDLRPPTSSINFITSHDGFTLRDLVSYTQKRNEANGEENRDGDSESHSINCGAEGETDDPAVNQRRLQLARAFWVSLVAAKGVPFITAGDERWRTQRGNNNAYCQDNELSWIDWSDDPTSQALTRFVKELLRWRLNSPEMRADTHYTGHIDPQTGQRDITWLDEKGQMLSHEAWHQPNRNLFGMQIAGTQPSLLLFNRGDEDSEFLLPTSEWEFFFDTHVDEPFHDYRQIASSHTWKVHAKSVLCLKAICKPT